MRVICRKVCVICFIGYGYASTLMEMQPNRSHPDHWFWFRLTDEELVSYFLESKVHGRESVGINGQMFPIGIIPVVEDFHTREPEHLPRNFFCRLRKKYPNSGSSYIDRATTSGYWKSTCKKKHIPSTSSGGGEKRTLRFYVMDYTTDWIMYQYSHECHECNELQNDFVLCHVKKSPPRKIRNHFTPSEMEDFTPSEMEDFLNSISFDP